MKYQKFFKMFASMTIIAVFSAFILSTVHKITQEPIEQAKKNKQLQAIAEVTEPFDNNPFAEKREIRTPDGKHKLEFFPARKNGVINSFAIKTYVNSGFGGRIELMAGFYIDRTIKTFKLIDHHETPGLGSKADEPRFKEQFNGFDINRQKFKVRQDGGEIDAITAATITSRAVVKAIQRAMDAYNHSNPFYNSASNNKVGESHE